MYLNSTQFLWDSASSEVKVDRETIHVIGIRFQKFSVGLIPDVLDITTGKW